ncbi:MAG: hypothetical protein M3Y53_10385 [Thermoproteota archaeon]|nr:hypothetical protein [Thermoproteota archaeon]
MTMLARGAKCDNTPHLVDNVSRRRYLCVQSLKKIEELHMRKLREAITILEVKRLAPQNCHQNQPKTSEYTIQFAAKKMQAMTYPSFGSHAK